MSVTEQLKIKFCVCFFHNQGAKARKGEKGNTGFKGDLVSLIVCSAGQVLLDGQPNP